MPNVKRLEFVIEKETSRTFRFKAVDVPGEAPPISTIYIAKWIFNSAAAVPKAVTIDLILDPTPDE